MPVILNPHGHYSNGRFSKHVQKRCAAFARMGAIAFSYDMVGFGDSKYLNWEHGSTYKVLKLQTLNSIRVLDFIYSLPNIDKTKIAITGSSGGGTQSFILAALDDRICLSIPTVMVSCHFFGGCKCESGMRIHKNDKIATNNAEIAALFAPKPQLIISDGDDWTRNTEKVEFPYLQKIYQLFNKESNVENLHLSSEKHDYGPSKRSGAYKFLAKHFGMDLTKVIDKNGTLDESFIVIEDSNSLRTFDAKHKPPNNMIYGTQFNKIKNVLDNI